MIVTMLLLNGCTTYNPRISKPSTEDSKQEWLAYYKDQFKAYGDSTMPPPDDAPEAARQAYSEARAKWQTEQAINSVVVGVL